MTMQLKKITGVYGYLFEQVATWAAYLYDSVHVYARALKECIEESGEVTDGLLIAKKIRGRSYKSELQSMLDFHSSYAVI